LSALSPLQGSLTIAAFECPLQNSSWHLITIAIVLRSGILKKSSSYGVTTSIKGFRSFINEWVSYERRQFSHFSFGIQTCSLTMWYLLAAYDARRPPAGAAPGLVLLSLKSTSDASNILVLDILLQQQKTK
jgi:hypothetical protein